MEHLGTQESTLDVVVVPTYRHLALDRHNRMALASGRPWLLVKPTGTQIWLGPLFGTGSACWQCLKHRLDLHDAVSTFVETHAPTEPLATPPPAYNTSTLALAYHRTAVEIVRLLVHGGYDDLANHVLVLDVLTGVSEKHIVTRRPQCPACGHPEIDATGAPPLHALCVDQALDVYV